MPITVLIALAVLFYQFYYYTAFGSDISPPTIQISDTINEHINILPVVDGPSLLMYAVSYSTSKELRVITATPFQGSMVCWRSNLVNMWTLCIMSCY